MKRIKSSKIICPDGIVDGYLYFKNGKIVEITANELPVAETYDAGDLWVSAGFIDIHTHGGGGYSFAGTQEEIVNGCNFHLRYGTTSICPTVSADRFDKMAYSVGQIAQAMDNPDLQGNIIGVHLEGPYLSTAQAGAQAPAHITAPVRADYLPLLQRYGRKIARWTYAPENDPDGQFADALIQHGVVASAGHTDAIYEQMRNSIAHGCKLVTHLYSCTSTITRDHGFRRLGVIETAWLEEDLDVEIIADGKHLPKELLRLICKIKGFDHIALITDSLSVAGSKETHGFMQDTEFIIEDGVCKLPDRSAFAGSIATADRLVRVMVKDAEVALPEAVKMITAVPARIMHLNTKGKLEAGMDADITVFDDEIQIKQVFFAGNRIV